MMDVARQEATISASAEELWAVLVDFERYPTWARDLKQVEVLERDGEGRGVEVLFRAAAMGRSTTYVLRYDHTEAPNRLPWKLVLPPVILGGIGIALIVWFEPQLCADGVRWPVLHDYQQQRICTLLDPTKDPLGKGFHIIQGMIAIGSGGVTGKGFMKGTQTHLEFIPERTTDFIFAAYAEEFGLLGNLFLICSFIFLVLRGLAIALEAPTLFTRLLAGAVTMIFFTYAFVNMGMVSGILPVVGVPLPFISYGGTAMVTLGLGLGILMSISRSKKLAAKNPDRLEIG